MAMPGRKYEAISGYRYGFNGKEKSDEIYGEGNGYDFGARIQDPRVGRWLSIDPLTKKFPSQSPYTPGSKEFYRYVSWAQSYQDKETEKMFSKLEDKKFEAA